MIRSELSAYETSRSKNTRSTKKWNPKKFKTCQEILSKIEPSTGEQLGTLKHKVGAIELVAAYFGEDFGNILILLDVS